MKELIEACNPTGIIIGLITFAAIGLFHPLVIKGEYYFGVKCWWVFLLLGVITAAAALLLHHVIASAACGVVACASFWSIGELYKQRQRVEKGWFPKREKGATEP